MELMMLSMVLTFVFGYFCIAFEHPLQINKTTSALLMGVALWVLQFSKSGTVREENLSHLSTHLANVSEVIVFLLGALIIVEIIQNHGGFEAFRHLLNVRSKRVMLWVIGFISFFLSSVLDNLTTTIVMITVMQKFLDDSEDKLIFGGAVVVAANAGGAWTPIGDVTTTMLWIGGQISAFQTMTHLFLPSFICLITSIACLTPLVQGSMPERNQNHSLNQSWLGLVILIVGGSLLIFVPIFKQMTGLPPFMGMIFGASVLWLITDIFHRNGRGVESLRAVNLLSRIDLSGPLFFLGILLSVDALETAGILRDFAAFLDQSFSSTTVIATLIGLSSSLIDNIPLVAASMGMYSLSLFPMDTEIWQLIAYCAGTGGSILIIGSAAGVVFMGMENVSFFSYLKKIALPALIGYFAGIGAYLYL